MTDEAPSGGMETRQAIGRSMKEVNPKTGVMADSHGEPDAILTAIRLFREKGCERLYHLGDICDSRYPERADECVRVLREHHVAMVKGNNDHILVVNHRNRSDTPIVPETLECLLNLPQRIDVGEIFFTHSLPFVEELGLAGMMWSMGPKEAARFFERYPGHSLFRGHSHTPEIMFLRCGQVVAEPLSPGEEIPLQERSPFVVTCGALMNSLCLMWDPDANTLQSISF